MKHLNIIALVFAISIMFSCTKNDKTTVILLGKESYVKNITNMIPDSLQDNFKQHFDVNDGYIPPKIEGSFIMSPKKRVYSNVSSWILTITEPDMEFTIENQHNRVARFTESGSTTIDTVYISGYDNLFTLYYIENETRTLGEYVIEMKQTRLFSGEVDADGIKNLYSAKIILEVKDGTGGLTTTYNPGSFFIYKDGDSISERKVW